MPNNEKMGLSKFVKEISEVLTYFLRNLPCSTAITNGVKVRASSVFIPEAADLRGHSKKYLFAYSIHMSLMPEGCIIGGMNFSSCQLHWRHWLICASDVGGEAVIGMFTLLCPMEKEFVYKSCASLPTSSGFVKGSFTFVPSSGVN
ncbi:F-box protein SKIP16-like [Pistacia vera]|uniref:F-box protein SKIP16-like n=1 Tax=Pistacia vera TaxID=55513 RepID=UPI001262E202|nr:F-box protein SKIP16-like [Pistacia vera]